MQQLPMQVPIKQVVVLHHLRLLPMQLQVVTGQVVPVHLLRIEMPPMQFIFLQYQKSLLQHLGQEAVAAADANS